MKKKLPLNELKVKSFVTQVNGKNQIVGGGKIPTLDGCMTGNYPTLDVMACARTESNGMNCPTDNGCPPIVVNLP